MFRAKAAAFVVLLTLAPTAYAQSPGKLDLEAAELAAELIGGPVYSVDGVEVGRVADITFDDAGLAERLRITTGGRLGLGEKTVVVSSGAYTLLRGAAVLDIPAEAMPSLPEFTEQDPDK